MVYETDAAMNALLQDLRFAVLLLLKDKTFNLVALLTLGLCIGANTAIFSVVNSILLRPLPFPEPDRIVEIYNSYPGVGVPKAGAAAPEMVDRRQETEIFDSISMQNTRNFDVGVEGSPQRLSFLAVTPSFFKVFRMEPIAGRAFSEEEGLEGGQKVILLSRGLWQELYAGGDVIGQEMRLSGEPYTIVGVLPQTFETVFERRAAVPLVYSQRDLSSDGRHSNNAAMMARLRPNVSVELAQQRVDAINARNDELYPEFAEVLRNAGYRSVVSPLHDELVKNVRDALYILLAAVAFVLLIGCVNVANLLLVRSHVRLKELSIRAALGAGQRRLARLLLTESLVLGALGALLGLAIGLGGVRLLNSLAGDMLPTGVVVQADSTVMLFTLGLGILTALLFGLVPLAHVLRTDLSQIVRQGGRGGTDARAAIVTRGALVVSQVSLAFLLLVGSGLLVASFLKAVGVDPGFQSEGVLTGQFTLPDVRYPKDEQVHTFVDSLLRDVRALPGVRSVGVTNIIPFSDDNNSSAIEIVGRDLGPGGLPPVPCWTNVDGDYFEAMGIPLLQGRYIDERDTAESEKVAVIDRRLADKHWPGDNPIGQQIRPGLPPLNKDEAPFTIVGVVGEIMLHDVTEASPIGIIYFANRQRPRHDLALAVRTESGADLTAAVTAAIQRQDPELPFYDVRTMNERLEDSLESRKALVWLSSLFGVLALLLSGVGIYGVLAYVVNQRTKEIGIRMALGAKSAILVRSVASQGLRLAGLGLTIGLATALLLTRLMESVLFHVTPGDPLVLAAVSTALMAVALFASLVPSLRATRIDPNTALRND